MRAYMCTRTCRRVHIRIYTHICIYTHGDSRLPRLADVAQDIVYKVRSSEYDPIIRQGVRNRKAPQDILQYEAMKEKYESIKDMRCCH